MGKVLVYMVGNSDYKALVQYPEIAPDIEEELDYPVEYLERHIKYDQIFVVGTIKAREKHKNRLQEKFGDKMRFIEMKTLGERKSTEAEEFWETFARVYKGLETLRQENEKESWRVDLDLTTGIRIDQMLVQESVRFFCDLYENCELGKLHYGYLDRSGKTPSNLPAVGSINGMSKTTYFDSTSLWDLASMSRSIHDFLKYNQSSELVNILKKIEENENLREYSGSFKKIREEVEQFSHVVAMNITPSAAHVIQSLCQSVKRLPEDAVRQKAGRLYPFVLAMKHLTSQLQVFLPKDTNPLWRWQKSLCQWCLERGLFQQAATQAEELVTTRLIEECARRNGLTEEEIRDAALDYENVRNLFGRAIITITKKCIEETEYFRKLDQRIDRDNESSIVSIRNNVNHAYMKKIGCGGEVDINSQVENLKGCVKELLKLLEEMPSDSFLDEIEKEWKNKTEKKKDSVLLRAIQRKLKGSTSFANSNGER